MKVTNLVYAMVKLNYLKIEDPEEEIYFIYLFIFVFFGGRVGWGVEIFILDLSFAAG